MVALKNCEPELSRMLAELFNMCLKEFCFSDCWKVSSVAPVFKNVRERSTAKNYCPVSLLSVVFCLLFFSFQENLEFYLFYYNAIFKNCTLFK